MPETVDKTSATSSEPIVVKDLGNVLLVTFYGEATDAQYKAHLEAMDVVIERNRRQLGKRWAVIIDATRWLRSNANQRKLHADWMKRHEQMMRQRTAGVAFAIDNAFVRGGLTAVLWLAPLPCPHTIVRNLAEALSWVELQLGESVVYDSAERKKG
jgi:hypothetical protein